MQSAQHENEANTREEVPASVSLPGSVTNVASGKESTKKEQEPEPHDDKVSKHTLPEKQILITEVIDSENASPMLPKGAIENPDNKQVLANKMH